MVMKMTIMKKWAQYFYKQPAQDPASGPKCKNDR